MDRKTIKNFLAVTNAETLSICDFEYKQLDNCTSFTFGELASLGAVFGNFPNAFSSVVQATKGPKVLYEATFPVAGKLAQAKDGRGFLGTILGKSGIVGQARFNPVTVGTTAQVASSTATMFMAVAIMAINKSLKEISKTQKDIISFLEIDKQSQLKGDLIVLTDIISDYQHNWNNDKYRNNREIQVLDIRRSSEQNILFYREMIDKTLSKQSFISFDISKILSKIQAEFRNYKLSVYLYAFSSFLDIILLENFDSDYLKSIVEKIEKYSAEYDEFFEKSSEKIESYVDSSIKSRALQGVAIAGKFVGKQLSKIPDKDNKMKLDDKLIAGSEKMNTLSKKSFKKTMENFTVVEDSEIALFADKIRQFDIMHNQQFKIIFDGEKIYLPTDSMVG